MDGLKQYCVDFLQTQNSDALALGVLRFKDKSFDSFQIEKARGRMIEGGQDIFFDLASLSKPLINSAGFFSQPERVGEKELLLLNHRAGLPAWGLLPKKDWEKIIKSYPIKKSPVLYSDFSALRFMLEFNEKEGESLREVAQKIWDKEVFFWKNLNNSHRTVQNGYLDGVPNTRKVHDPNALNLDEFVSHAGLFGTVAGVCETLLNFDRELQLLPRMRDELGRPCERFVLGWDTVSDPQNTLAGKGCGKKTFGHLGFTGVSIWIDPEKEVGHVLLTNTTKEGWHQRSGLNEFRNSLGALIWEMG